MTAVTADEASYATPSGSSGLLFAETLQGCSTAGYRTGVVVTTFILFFAL